MTRPHAQRPRGPTSRAVRAALVALALGAASPALAQGDYAVVWSTFDGGGQSSGASPYVLLGTSGQPEAGAVGGGAYLVLGGFWPGVDAEAPTPTKTPTRTATASASATASRTPTPSATRSPTLPPPPPTATMTATRTASGTPTLAPSATRTATATTTRSASATATGSPSPSATRTATPTATPSTTRSASATATGSPSPSQSVTRTATPTATRTPTATTTRAPSSTPTPSATPTPTATPVPGCTGDCDASSAVTIDELVRGVRIALEIAPIGLCPAFDGNGDRQVATDELRAAVEAALGGCPAVPAGFAAAGCLP